MRQCRHAALRGRQQRFQPGPVSLPLLNPARGECRCRHRKSLPSTLRSRLRWSSRSPSAGSRFLALAIDTLIQIGDLPRARRSSRLGALWLASQRLQPGRPAGSLAVLVFAGVPALLRLLRRVRGAVGRPDAGQAGDRHPGDPRRPGGRSPRSTRCSATCCGSSTSCRASTPSASSRCSSRAGTSASAISPPAPWW